MSRRYNVVGWSSTVVIFLSILTTHLDYTGISLLLTLVALGLMVWSHTMLPNIGEEHRQRYVAKLREHGLYPVDSRTTDADVARLKQGGDKMLAIRLWLEIHGGSLREAKRAVERM